MSLKKFKKTMQYYNKTRNIKDAVARNFTPPPNPPPQAPKRVVLNC